MKVLIIGSGGREHALTWKVQQSPLVTHIFAAPGNAGTQQEPKTQNIPINADDITSLVEFALKENIDLTIVGPEVPLVLGIVDSFQEQGLAIFGPNQKAAQLEGSKAFCKDFLKKYHIPTADYQVFHQIKPAVDYLKNCDYPIVIKASGLAAGKGVIIAHSVVEATQAVESMLSKDTFGEAGHTIIIESFLTGEELSYMVMVDGKHYIPFASSQDHKARDDQDKGPNTGGMGAYSPAPILSKALEKIIQQTIIEPTLKGLYYEGIEYTGFLYAGLMISQTGEPKVLEYNCRLGDPETQPLMMRLESDLITLIQSALNQELSTLTPFWSPKTALGVVMAANGYPNTYQKGTTIHQLPANTQDSYTYHAGTCTEDNILKTSGGRVLCITALGDNTENAKERAYRQVQSVDCDDLFYRNDIGDKAIKKEGHLATG